MHRKGRYVSNVESVSPELSVRRGRAALGFYKAAFGAIEIYRVGGTEENEDVVAQLSVGNRSFWVSDESPPHRNFSPESLGGSTVRLLLVVEDPHSMVERAVALGAAEVRPPLRDLRRHSDCDTIARLAQRWPRFPDAASPETDPTCPTTAGVRLLVVDSEAPPQAVEAPTQTKTATKAQAIPSRRCARWVSLISRLRQRVDRIVRAPGEACVDQEGDAARAAATASSREWTPRA